MNLACAFRGGRLRRGLSLLEMMVAMAMLAVIMLGLLSIFSHTQKALHVAHTQSDVFENARGAVQMVARDLAEMTASKIEGFTNALGVSVASPTGTLVLPAGGNVNLDMNEVFWLARVNDDWQGIGYYVAEDPLTRTNLGVGTLFRFHQTVRRDALDQLLPAFLTAPVTNRVSDGIVHFQVAVIYLSGTNGLGQPIYDRADSFTFLSNDLPAYVDLELGVLEPNTLKQFQSIAALNAASAQNFLREHAGQIHFFRERVPVRNFLNPYRANEVP